MDIKKIFLVLGAISSIGAAGLVGNDLASAATSSSKENTLVDKIASTFNLNKEQVQKVFDQDRKDRQIQEDKDIENKLNQLVKDGKITQDQKSKILAKRQEIKNDREINKDSFKDKTSAERKSAMDQKRTELEKWANDNGISTEYLRYVFGGPGHGKHLGHMNRGNTPDPAQ